MPEVRDWVAGSGLTLDELASIQPGYAEPVVETWGRIAFTRIDAGDYVDEREGGQTTGTLRRGRMEGM